ncbi:hypothetical protein GA0115239_102418 [Streptomyces sp. BpilaLS-43]|nr:hypothetical protein GA0115239_102418 [Streptomyces sp. BpilaLS-43]
MHVPRVAFRRLFRLFSHVLLVSHVRPLGHLSGVIGRPCPGAREYVRIVHIGTRRPPSEWRVSEAAPYITMIVSSANLLVRSVD